MIYGLKKILMNVILILVSTLIMTGQSAERIRTGSMYVPLPAFQYNTDKGLIFGAVLMIYDFGKGEYYPNTRKNITLNAMYSTKGSADLSASYENKHFLNDFRLSSSVGYRRDKCFQFYGINGYQSPFDPTISPVYYYFDQSNLWVDLDIMKPIGKSLKFKAGYSFQYINNQIADLNNINKGKEDTETFNGMTLFEKYLNWGIFSADEISNVVISRLKTGLRFDTRDQEAAPQSGILADADMEIAPGFLGSGYSFYRYEISWRHFIPLVREKLIFAYRLDYTGLIGNSAPFLALPVNNSVRGVLMNRIQSRDIAFMNSEIRWLSDEISILNQYVAIGLNAFFDSGRAVRLYDASIAGSMEYRNEYEDYLASGKKEYWHSSIGTGLQILVNRNFICRIEYGHPLDGQDNFGNSVYFTFGYHF